MISLRCEVFFKDPMKSKSKFFGLFVWIWPDPYTENLV